MSDFQENGYLFVDISVNQQSPYTIRKVISKLALNRLINVKVIDLAFFSDSLFSDITSSLRI